MAEKDWHVGSTLPIAVQAVVCLAAVVAREPGEEARIRRAYRILFSRDPLPRELVIGREFLRGKANAWPEYTQALLSSNEFLYVK